MRVLKREIWREMTLPPWLGPDWIPLRIFSADDEPLGASFSTRRKLVPMAMATVIAANGWMSSFVARSNVARHTPIIMRAPGNGKIVASIFLGPACTVLAKIDEAFPRCFCSVEEASLTSLAWQ